MSSMLPQPYGRPAGRIPHRSLHMHVCMGIHVLHQQHSGSVFPIPIRSYIGGERGAAAAASRGRRPEQYPNPLNTHTGAGGLQLSHRSMAFKGTHSAMLLLIFSSLLLTTLCFVRLLISTSSSECNQIVLLLLYMHLSCMHVNLIIHNIYWAVHRQMD